MYTVYKHTTPNGKVYIGITSQKPTARWNEGKSYLKQKYFGSAILKYGWENIKHEILFEDLTKEEACKKEIELIAEYKSNQKEFGYNLSSGGEFGGKGVRLSEETRNKMSESRKGDKNCNFGKHLSKITKEKLRLSHLRENLSQETLDKMSKNNCGRCKEKHWNYGNKYSMEQRKKLSESHKHEMKKVICLETKCIYDSISEASRQTKINRGNISNVCHNRQSLAGGFHWKYYDELR